MTWLKLDMNKTLLLHYFLTHTSILLFTGTFCLCSVLSYTLLIQLVPSTANLFFFHSLKELLRSPEMWRENILAWISKNISKLVWKYCSLVRQILIVRKVEITVYPRFLCYSVEYMLQEWQLHYTFLAFTAAGNCIQLRIFFKSQWKLLFMRSRMGEPNFTEGSVLN